MDGNAGNGRGGGRGLLDVAGPAKQLWRNVYAKAAEVAERRAKALVDYHVYVYPHSAGGGGGGGGGLVLVETQTLADDTASQVTFTTIPADGAGLLLVVSAHQVSAAGAGSLLLRLNDDATTNYYTKWHEVYGAAAAPTHQTLGADATYVPLGRLSIADGLQDPADATAGIVALLPGHGISGRRKEVLALGSAFTNISLHWSGQYGGEWRGTAAITKLTLLPSGSAFGAGSVFSLYQFSLSAAAAASGGTPDALQARVDALEARLAALEASSPPPA